MSSVLRILSCLFALVLGGQAHAQSAIIRLTQPRLMNEVRNAPSPADGKPAAVNPPRFMWQDKYPHLGAVLDGVDDEHRKPQVTYRIRIAADPGFTQGVISAERAWAFFNPSDTFAPGTYYWQHAYVSPDGNEEWSPVYTFEVSESTPVFNPPSYSRLIEKLPLTHPRILLDADKWDEIIERNLNNPEAQSYLTKADKCMKRPLKSLDQEIDTSAVVKLSNAVQYKAALIRESRKIVDREEKNIEGLVRAYLLSRNPVYYKEAMKRLGEVLSWADSKYFAGDFNLGTLLSMSTSAYDAFYHLLTKEEKALLLNCIRENGNKFYNEFVNHLENRIADNHVWQMTFRILTMAAFATYGELPEANVWTDYCYNQWVSRFPGLNDDGGWHNGDAYFHVNIRTLIEVPAFYQRISGFDYFADPWYKGNIRYIIYQQPPFSKSAGQGNSHENQRKPTGARVGYADALARQCNDPWATAYVRYISERQPDILQTSFEAKPSDLTWYRCITPYKLPEQTRTLAELPRTHVHNETGIAAMHTALDKPEQNAMLSFRSSSYGSTSHALANQNAFNTFYGGKPIFYSSGHRTGFTDDHSMYSYRNTRAHNSILVNGMGQIIGTEGYGWIPRWYEGEEISYFVGDASNAYGKVSSPLWLKRAQLSETAFTPENGWDENKVDFFRRHIIQLGDTGIYVIYDELEGKEAVSWSYLLHTTEFPMTVRRASATSLIVEGRNSAHGVSKAHLFCSSPIKDEVSDKFFTPPTNWKNVTDKDGKTVIYPNHWHFSATTPLCQKARFLTIIDTHGKERADLVVKQHGDTWEVAGWSIHCNLTPEGKAAIRITHPTRKASLEYDAGKKEGITVIEETIKGETVRKELKDLLPDFEI